MIKPNKALDIRQIESCYRRFDLWCQIENKFFWECNFFYSNILVRLLEVTVRDKSNQND
jgi:hypothetical protein